MRVACGFAECTYSALAEKGNQDIYRSDVI